MFTRHHNQYREMRYKQRRIMKESNQCSNLVHMFMTGSEQIFEKINQIFW